MFAKNHLHPVKLFLWVNKIIKRLATRIIETQVDDRWSTDSLDCKRLNSDNSFSTAVMVFIRVSVKMWIQQYNCNLAVQQTQKLIFSIVLKRSTVFIERNCCCRLQQGHCKNKGSMLQNLLETDKLRSQTKCNGWEYRAYTDSSSSDPITLCKRGRLQ